MGSPRTVLVDYCYEDGTARLTGTLYDATGVPVGVSQIGTLTLTLYAVGGAFPIINTRDHVDIKNANGGTVDANGLLTYELTPADNDLVLTPEGQDETHRALIEWTYGGGSKKGKAEVEFRVKAIEKVA